MVNFRCAGVFNIPRHFSSIRPAYSYTLNPFIKYTLLPLSFAATVCSVSRQGTSNSIIDIVRCVDKPRQDFLSQCSYWYICRDALNEIENKLFVIFKSRTSLFHCWFIAIRLFIFRTIVHRYSFSFSYQSILKLNKMDRFLHEDRLEVTNERAIIKQKKLCLPFYFSS